MSLSGKWFGFGKNEDLDEGIRAREAGNLELAIEKFERAMKSQSTDVKQLAKAEIVPCLKFQTQHWLAIGEAGSALKTAKRAVELNPNFVDLIVLHSRALAMKGETNGALKSLVAALALNPRAEEPKLRLIQLALSHPEKELKTFNPWQDWKRERNIPDGEEGLAVIDEMIGNLNDRAQVLLADAKAKIAERNYSEAAALLRNAAELRPGYADVQCLLGQCLLELDQVDNALPHFERAIEINPKYAEAHAQRGIALKRMRRADDAKRAFERVLAINPHHVIAALEVSRT